MKRDKFVDFFAVAPHQQDMHKRLENWAQSCFSGGGSSCSPMFRLYRPDNYERGTPASPWTHTTPPRSPKGWLRCLRATAWPFIGATYRAEARRKHARGLAARWKG